MQMYFIAIVLPGELNEKVLKYKNMMLEKYNCTVALKSPAHITLVPPFWMEEEKESTLRSDIDAISNELVPFILRTDNFSAFKPRTIFVAVANNSSLQAVKEKTDAYFTSRKSYGVKSDTRPFHPHITIATRDLFKKTFYEIWPWFESKEFKEEWKVDSISLLRHNKKNWDVVHTSQFSN